MDTRRFVIVDVFTDTPLAGNQLAVFTNATGLTDAQMQSLAREVGFSETTFVLPAEKGGDARVRIFAPERELPFAGHPVLGTAFALAGPLQSLVLRMETRMGIVPVTMEREGAKLVFGRMQQPVPSVEPYGDATELLAAIGVTESVLPVDVYDNGVQHVFVALPDFASVAAIRPNLEALEDVAPDHCVNVFAFDGQRAKNRMFWHDAGVNEDAATGSAAGPLAVHLCRNGLLEWGTEFAISQGAEIHRPSTLYASAYLSDGEVDRVEVGGSAVVVAKGEFKLS